MKKTIDKYHSIDGFHFKDLMDNGRCVNCGKLATINTAYNLVQFFVCSPVCEDRIKDFIDAHNQS